MKRALPIVMVALLALVGCAGWTIQNEQMANVAVELAGYNLGYFVAKDKPSADVPLRNAYTLARTGTLPPDQVALALADLKITDPLLMGNCVIVLKAMGAGFAPTGEVADLTGIPPEMWDAAANGYLQGFALGQMAKK